MKKKSKNLLLLIIVLAVIGIGVGYAALSQNLVINGTTTTKAADDWDVIISEIDDSANTTGASNISSSVNADKVSGTFAATLIPGGSVTFTVTTKNEGTIKASASTPEITYGAGGDSSYVSCTVTPNGSNAASISNNETHTYDVKMEYVGSELPTSAVTENVIVTFPYTQAE